MCFMTKVNQPQQGKDMAPIGELKREILGCLCTHPNSLQLSPEQFRGLQKGEHGHRKVCVGNGTNKFINVLEFQGKY